MTTQSAHRSDAYPPPWRREGASVLAADGMQAAAAATDDVAERIVTAVNAHDVLQRTRGRSHEQLNVLTEYLRRAAERVEQIAAELGASADVPAPRVFTSGDPEPEPRPRVRDRHQREWKPGHFGLYVHPVPTHSDWQCNWGELLEIGAPLVEVVEAAAQ